MSKKMVYGGGLDPLPIRDYTRCVHGTRVEDDCKQCCHEIKHPRAKTRAVAPAARGGWPA